ncbi:hypothetical protein CEUSTIGMA_g7253.t1 [Chlamydomonas eustigma]|uniref:Uncharacterized protein n=1 Tax=Chlamydomonas eustigma TaxID=1157962 RepID=A0A250X9M7_9CHLO|nr:hypothetical protein CEUSTIGMA_g7253.t1 [Chlamydomonas eustigma]|eukprot:GAX79813.1 hypothetical protein CEUSTIGMA_g7253.t1 [Chlamydomonas eustigma]
MTAILGNDDIFNSGSIADNVEQFTPFTFDAAPLQKLLSHLVKQIETCQQENLALRNELNDLKVGQRLSTLEQSIQELADQQRPDAGYGGYAMFPPPGAYVQQAYFPPPSAQLVQQPQMGLDLPQEPATASAGEVAPPVDPKISMDGSVSSITSPALPVAPAQRKMLAAENGHRTSIRGGVGGAFMMNPGAVMITTPQSVGAGGGVMMSANGVMMGGPMMGGGGDWILFEFNQVKERMTQMERKAEALWHVQEKEQEMKGVTDRLVNDLDSIRSSIQDMSGSLKSSQHSIDRLEATGASATSNIQLLTDRLVAVDAELKKNAEEKRESAAKLENNVNLIWDQIRHMENSFSQRLTLAETSQVSTLQEVDEIKESAGEVLGRVEDVKRHIAALESKLESFNTQVAAAISPLHNSMSDVKVRLEDLSNKKLDIIAAVSLDDVNTAVSRAIDHADRRADNIIKSIGAMEGRVEELNDVKANKSDVVMTTDLEALLTAHAAELDRHLEGLKEEIMRLVSAKADKEELGALDVKLGARIGSLENAILKGLKAISDKVSAALAEKLDLLRFNEFKLQVRAILADVEDRLRDWSPVAKAYKVPLDGTGNLGASSCLCCDSRVRSVKDIQSMGFNSTDKVFSPERLPMTEGLLPSIQRSPEVAAHNNARYLSKKKESHEQMKRQAANIPEGIPGVSAAARAGSAHGGVSVMDGSVLPVGEGAQKGVKVDVETISGSIAQGRLPTKKPVPQALRSQQKSPSDLNGSWEGSGTSPGRESSLTEHLQINNKPHSP